MSSRVTLAALAASAALGCGAGAPPAPQPSAEPAPAWVPEGAGAVVAQVNGEPVFATCVAAQLGAGTASAAAALDECIGFELLAQEARARGLLAHPEVREKRQAESVRALLTREFEPTMRGPEDVPAPYLDEIWRRSDIQARFNHPEIRYVRYARAEVPRQAPPGGPEDRTARAVADRVYQALRDARGLTVAGFGERARAAAQPAALVVSGAYNLPRHRRAEEPFAAATFAIAEPGRVSRPTRTRSGWDVILLTKVLPARQATRAEAGPELASIAYASAILANPGAGRPRLNARERAFFDWVAALSRGHQIEVHAERLPAPGGPVEPGR